ncbi:MAG: hypothetical protein DDT26_02608 [Dehalococcoidia bacterium]|nr:hypothetical protein [Chloroflexota bacterium]
MPAPIVVGALAGGVVGYIVGKDQQVQPIYAHTPRNEPTPALPEPHIHVSRRILGVGERMAAVEWQVTGNTIIVEDMTLTGRLFVRFNDLSSESIAMHLVNKIVFAVPFWRLFFDAPVQLSGSFTIVVGTGLELHERPLRAEMAELAARLGSPNTFDRRGDIVWMDDFEDNINKWVITTWGVGASVVLSTEAARNGARSAKLVTGNAINESASIEVICPILLIANVGFEFSFAGNPPNSVHEVSPNILTGTHLISPRIEYIASTGTLRIRNEFLQWINLITGHNLRSSIRCFHTMKVVVDVPARRYIRLLLDSLTFDISQHNILVTPDTRTPDTHFNILYRTTTAVTRITYIDNVIITQNEP